MGKTKQSKTTGKDEEKPPKGQKDPNDKKEDEDDNDENKDKNKNNDEENKDEKGKKLEKKDENKDPPQDEEKKPEDELKDEKKNPPSNDGGKDGKKGRKGEDGEGKGKPPSPDNPSDPIAPGEKKEVITSGELIDLLSKLNLDLVKHEIPEVEVSQVDLDFFKRTDEIKLEVIESAECIYEVWKDVPNNRFYLLNKLTLEQRGSHEFKTIDEFLLYMLSEFERQFKKSCRIIREPSKTMILETAVFEPSKLGFPIEEMMDPTCVDDNIRGVITGFCRPPNEKGKILQSYTMDEPEVNDCRNKMIAYAQNQTEQNIQQVEAINLIRLRAENKQIQRIPRLQSWELRYPSLPCNSFQGPFDEMELGSFIRAQYIAHVSTPEVVFKSADPGEMIKDSGANTTKAGFLTNLISTEYKPYMADQIAMWVLSLMCPSDIIIEFDFKDINDYSSEYIGFLSLVVKMFTMYEENGVYCNISRKSLLEIEKNIARWASSKGVLDRIPNANDDFSLNNYRFSGRNNNAGDVNALNNLRTTNGISGINAGVQPNNHDELARLYPNIMPRRNYAVDAQDFELFDTTSTYDVWPVSNSISHFLMRFRNTNWSNVFSSMQRNMLRWFVRLNEYLSVYWYNGFRMKGNVSAGRHPANFESKSWNVVINGNTIAYMMKSFTYDAMRPRLDFIDILRFQSSFAKELVLARVRTTYLERLIALMRLQRSFSRKAILEMTISNCPPLRQILNAGEALSNQDRVYDFIMRYTDEEFMNVIEPLTRISANGLIKKGIISDVIIHQTINRCTPEQIKGKINTGTYLDNFENTNFNNPMNYSDIINLMNNRSLKSTFYDTVMVDKRIDLRIFLPYTYNHEIGSVSNRIPIEINNVDSSNNLRKRLSIHTVPVTSVVLDKRDFIYEDNYVEVTTAPEACFIPSALRNQLIIEVKDAFSQPANVISRTPLIAKKKFCFVSSFDRTL